MAFTKYAKYYDILYQDKNYNLEVEYINQILEKFSGKKLNILELGCGSGGHAFKLKKKGHKIIGIDSSKRMIKIAKKKNIGNKIKFLNKDLINYKPKKKFDAIILLFHVINFLKLESHLKILSRNAFKSLKQNGIIIFDFINYSGVIKDKPKNKIKIVENKNIKIFRKTIPELKKKNKILKINFNMKIEKNKKIIDEFKEIHILKLYSIDLIKKIFQKNFALIDIYKWMDFKKIKKENWFGLFIFKKIR